MFEINWISFPEKIKLIFLRFRAIGVRIIMCKNKNQQSILNTFRGVVFYFNNFKT